MLNTLVTIARNQWSRSAEYAEMDEFYILMNIPNFAISERQRPLFEKAIIELGCGWKDNYQKVNDICSSLRALE